MATETTPFRLDEIQLPDKPPFEFEWDGETYVCLDPSTTDIRRIREAVIEGDSEDPSEALRFMVGEEQYERLDASDGVFTVYHLQALSEAWLAHHGTSAPKSSGSRPSSKRIR
jgi:hypothetical protein